MNEIAGYSLFNDIEDKEVQIYNRARIMKNMMQDNSKDKEVSEKGVGLLVLYMNAIPVEDRKDVYVKLEELLKKKDVE